MAGRVGAGATVPTHHPVPPAPRRTATRTEGAATPLSPRHLAWVRRAAATTVAVLVAATVVLRAANHGAAVDTWWIGNLGLTCGLGLVGALLARRLPANPIGWILLVGAVGQGLVGAGREYAVHAHVVDPGSLPAADWAAWAGTWGSVLSLASLPLVLLRFPDGRLPTPRWRWVERLVVVAAAIALVTQAIYPGDFTEELPGFANPAGLDEPWVAPASDLSFIALQLGTLAAYASLLRRWSGAPAPLRAQLRWVTITAGALVLDIVLEGTPLGQWWAFELLAPALLLLFIASIGLAVLRHQLWDIDVVVNVSLVYVVLAIAFGATVAGVVVLTGVRSDGRSIAWPSVLVLALAAVGFLPLRRAVQGGVDRLLYGRRTTPDGVLAGLGERLADPNDPDRVLTEAVEAIAAAHLRLDYVGLRVVGAGPAPVVETGRARTDPVTIDLVYQGVRVGELEVAGRPGARLPLRPQDLLGSTTEALAAVVHAVTVTRAVRDARQALLTAREEERRRLRRDLHDGLGPALAAIAMQADAAAVLAAKEPQRSRALMTGVARDVRDTIEDVRRLVYDLQPPVLDAIGLAAAVRERAIAFSGTDETAPSGLRVEVDAPTTLGPLPAAVETAAYRIVCEALANSARHSQAHSCIVTLERTEDPGTVRVLVDDDGVGMSTDGPTHHGVGVLSMVGRATELGGSCQVGPSPRGGTRVAATLPISGRAQA